MVHKYAKEIAIKICYQLQPFCDKINIAGSIRRKKPEVKDIEIICLPKKIEIPTSDLFGSGEKKYMTDPLFIDVVNSLGKTLKGRPTGKMMQIEVEKGIMVDLFMPEERDYYRQYVIRTGSADYSHRVIATAWLKIGWCGSDYGLRKISDCIEITGPDGKRKWKCINKNGGLPPAWSSEEDFFDWLKVKFIHPGKRDI